MWREERKKGTIPFDAMNMLFLRFILVFFSPERSRMFNIISHSELAVAIYSVVCRDKVEPHSSAFPYILCVFIIMWCTTPLYVTYICSNIVERNEWTSTFHLLISSEQHIRNGFKFQFNPQTYEINWFFFSCIPTCDFFVCQHSAKKSRRKFDFSLIAWGFMTIHGTRTLHFRIHSPVNYILFPSFCIPFAQLEMI